MAAGNVYFTEEVSVPLLPVNLPFYALNCEVCSMGESHCLHLCELFRLDGSCWFCTPQPQLKCNVSHDHVYVNTVLDMTNEDACEEIQFPVMLGIFHFSLWLITGQKRIVENHW